MALGLAGPAFAQASKPTAASTAAVAPAQRAVITHYADLAQAMYTDSYNAAREMQTAINAFLAAPSAETQAAAREAWKKARNPYMKTEAFRFGNKIVDQWEGNVNAWPLDEGLVDYVDTKSYGTKSDENRSIPPISLPISRSASARKPSISPTSPSAAAPAQLCRRRRSERGERLARHRILLWGPGPARHDRGAGERPWTITI